MREKTRALKGSSPLLHAPLCLRVSHPVRASEGRLGHEADALGATAECPRPDHQNPATSPHLRKANQSATAQGYWPGGVAQRRAALLFRAQEFAELGGVGEGGLADVVFADVGGGFSGDGVDGFEEL